MYSNVYGLLASATESEVFSDSVPESAKLPAVCFYNMRNSYDRVLSGEKSGKWSQWRIEIVANTLSQAEALTQQFELLDNTSNIDFDHIKVDFVRYEEKDVRSPLRRAFIDLTLY